MIALELYEFKDGMAEDEMFQYVKGQDGEIVVRAKREFGSVEWMIYRNGAWHSIVRCKFRDYETGEEYWETTDDAESPRSAAYGYFKDIASGKYSAVMVDAHPMVDLEVLAEKFEEEYPDFDQEDDSSG